MGDAIFKCHNCGKKPTYIFPVTQTAPTQMFCSDCGAKMELVSVNDNPNVQKGLHPSHILKPQEKSEIPEGAIVIETENDSKNESLVFEETLPQGFVIAVEETAQLGEPFICMANHEGKKLYFRKGEKQGEYTHLIPLTKSELKGLKIEETANDDLQNYFNVKIEEVV